MTATRDQELPVEFAGFEGRFTLRSPLQECEAPSLLLNLARERAKTLSEYPYCLASDIFLAAGHHVASFDLPNHGDCENQFGAGLTGMAAAVKEGVDVFDQIRRCGQAVVGTCVSLLQIPPERVFVCGTSRGGLAALHVMAAIPTVAAAAVFAPVTRIVALKEFKELSDHPIVRAGDANQLVPQLNARPICIAIGRNDARVGTEHAVAFHAALEKAGTGYALLHLDHAPGHRVSDASHHRGAAFLLNIAARQFESSAYAIRQLAVKNQSILRSHRTS